MKKILVANRSEIAIRVMRAATELGLSTVAVYTYEDRFGLHRFKADESYQIGPALGGEPVKGYLNIDNIVRVCKQCGVDAVHPGYGFLSERGDFARALEKNGITFIGPSPDLLERFGDKTAAKELADRSGVPTIPGTGHGMTNPKDVVAAAKKIGFPVILKASFGGGGRGMRVVLNAEELPGKLDEAQREAGAAFGRTEVFVEKYIRRAKHIEVQIMGDKHGNIVHIWERDCSVQRRHQKVVEVAPAATLPLALRIRICESAKSLMKEAGYYNAGTVEFLLDVDTSAFYFIEVNPRVQVEHTVTELVCGVDIVRTQILVAQGHKLHDDVIRLPKQEDIEPRGVAIQCRITTEDPANKFTPDYGRLTTYRSAAGLGIRLDGGTAYAGAQITPYFDSLLVKVSAFDNTLENAAHRMDRALREFRIRGVKSNIAFLENVIKHPAFLSGDVTTTFIDNTPELFTFAPRQDRATKLLRYLGDVIVNARPDVKARYDANRRIPTPVVPDFDLGKPIPKGTKDKLAELGPKKFAEWTRKQKRLLITDTTMRDAHQSLLATRVRTYDILKIADYVAREMSGLFSLEMWGGATFDTSMRFLQEDPWERLAQMRQRVPNILFQMLLRGANAVGYTNYPDNVVKEFVKASSQAGIDVFRIFDSLNDPDGLKVAMKAVREETSSICEGTLCYTGDILDPKRTKYSLAYYVKLVKQLEKMGAHTIAIKDMSGLCKPFAAKALVKALRNETDLPIHFHTHDTSGISAASVLSASEAGVDIVDLAIASMSGMMSQPNMNSIVAALENSPRQTGLDLDTLNRASEYWEAVRNGYYPFEEDIKSGTAEVYLHEMPGGQFTNLKQQAKSLGLENRWRDVAAAYAAVNELFGDIVKVTPSSKVVGDMALFMVTNDLSVGDVLAVGQEGGRKIGFPKSVIEAMQGYIGTPSGGWPKVVQKIILDSAGVKPLAGRPGASMPDTDFAKVATELSGKINREPTPLDVQSYLMYPQVFLDLNTFINEYGNTSVVPTPAFFFGMQSGEEVNIEIEPGKSLVIKFLAVGMPNPDGTRTVNFELNGQPRDVNVPDRSMGDEIRKHPRADTEDPHHIGAPMPGKISSIAVKKGAKVKPNERLLSIEAMKMETAIYAPRAATIKDVLVTANSIVTAGDLLIVLE